MSEEKKECGLCAGPANEDGHCFGCGKYLCEECMVLKDDPPMGSHSIEDHRAE